MTEESIVEGLKQDCLPKGVRYPCRTTVPTIVTHAAQYGTLNKFENCFIVAYPNHDHKVISLTRPGGDTPCRPCMSPFEGIHSPVRRFSGGETHVSV